ncbi:MAG: acyltransferase [Sphingobacteriaceae bacterium]|nr:MAG: acyltransferase [Sphingobacteriaceae bacterium]
MLRDRIKTLDGLRALAAVGVLWIHVWTIHGNPRCYLWKIDLANILAIGGNGVDLFFVISGFCMNYFYGRKAFTYHDFMVFLKKRWIRLSPAFYTAVVFYMIGSNLFHYGDISFMPYLLTSAFYLNAILYPYNVAAHFWTLSTEWQFYLAIPFILIYKNSIGFKKIYLIVFGALLLSACLITFILGNRSDQYTYQLFFRGAQFGFGVLAAHMFMGNKNYFSNRALWLLIFMVITYSGRILISKGILQLSDSYYNIFKLSGFTIIGAGFAGILYLALTSKKWLNLVLGNPLFASIGKISYSFYLWHAMVYPFIYNYINHAYPIKGFIAPVITTIMSAMVLYPIAWLSFLLLEKPFMKKKPVV